MSLKTAAELVKLSVSDLEKELAGNEYPSDTLEQAKQLEQDDQNRKTAVEAYDAVLDVKEDEPKEPVKTGVFVAEGSAVTSKRGILSNGAEVTARDFVDGDKTIAALIKRKLLVKVG